MRDIWSRLLDEPQPDLDDDFFDVGGDSLLLAELRARLVTELGVELPDEWFYTETTLGNLIKLVTE